MGLLAVVDPCLLDAAERHPEVALTAYEVALLQAGISGSSGHILAFNDPYLRQWLRYGGAGGLGSHASVRCLRCGAAAAINDWSGMMLLSGEGRRIAWERIMQSRGQSAAEFLSDCTGNERGASRLAILAEMVKGEGE